MRAFEPWVQVGCDCVGSGLPKFGHAQHQQQNTTLFIRIGSKNRLPGGADYSTIYYDLNSSIQCEDIFRVRAKALLAVVLGR